MDFGKCSEEGHGKTTCTNTRGALAAQEDALTTATYDGIELRLNGEALGHSNKRRNLVTRIHFLPFVTFGFGYTSLSSINIPKGRVMIGDFAFYGCTSLFSVHLPKGVTTIGRWAFNGCTFLSLTNLPEGLTEIEGSAFEGCTSLSLTNLPEGLITIGDQAFSGCTLLEQRSLAAGHPNVVSYLRFISSRANRRYAVLASLARLREELYARQAKRARHQTEEDDAVEEEALEVVLEEQAGVLRGTLAFDIIHSDDLWRHILEFV